MANGPALPHVNGSKFERRSEPFGFVPSAREQRLRFKGAEAGFTRLHANIVQEDGGFTVSIRLHNHLNETESASGEEIAPTFELASSMVDALATRFAIEQSSVSISIVMQTFKDGTFH